MKVFKTRKDLISTLPKNISIAEIGVFEGGFSKQLFNLLSPSKLYLVDIFEGEMGSGDKDGVNFKFINLDECFKSLKDLFKSNTNVEVVKSTSFNFFSNLQDEVLDAVYIDADHSYESVRSDLDMSFKKVKEGGFIMGHDFCLEKYPSVVRAVDEFCNKNKQSIHAIAEDGCPSFLIIKKLNCSDK